jgi:hypothetical protein
MKPQIVLSRIPQRFFENRGKNFGDFGVKKL